MKLRDWLASLANTTIPNQLDKPLTAEDIESISFTFGNASNKYEEYHYDTFNKEKGIYEGHSDVDSDDELVHINMNMETKDGFALDLSWEEPDSNTIHSYLWSWFQKQFMESFDVWGGFDLDTEVIWPSS
jgi:hypothetical protein